MAKTSRTRESEVELRRMENRLNQILKNKKGPPRFNKFSPADKKAAEDLFGFNKKRNAANKRKKSREKARKIKHRTLPK